MGNKVVIFKFIKKQIMIKVIYSNLQKVREILQNIKKAWASKLHILADFDKTLTKTFVNGEKRPSLISVLRSQKILGEDYSKKAYELFDYYHPIEIDSQISLEEKKEKMAEWWEKHLDLLVKSWLKKENIDTAINSGIIYFRKGVKEFLEELNRKNIPLIIISANWLGTDSIKLYLKQNKVDFPNIFVISNEFIWDENWVVKWYKQPIIHTFNKDETVLKEFPEIYEKVKNRKNVILLWDSLWDPQMIEGFDYENLLKVWFLNDKEEELLEKYKQNYNIIISWDWDFEEVNKIIKEIN